MKGQVNEVAANADRPAVSFGYIFVRAAIAGAGFFIMWGIKANPFRTRFFFRSEPLNSPAVHERTDESGLNGSASDPIGLPPGNYTRETLPPPRPRVAEILDEVRRDAEALRSQSPEAAEKLGDAAEGQTRMIVPTDRGKTVIRPTDQGKRAIRTA